MAQQKLNMSPFKDANLFELGSKQHWGTLKTILNPITTSSFAVTDAVKLTMVDDARNRLDSSSGDVNGVKGNALRLVVASGEDGHIDTLKSLLAAGVDPDLPDHDGFRPSHQAAFLGRYKVAKAIFQCRPDMSALNNAKDTPLMAASKACVFTDFLHPQGAPLRRDIAAFFKNNGYQNGFPTLAELAVRQKWFAVKNLIRRQVVPLSEFNVQCAGKTAAEWAEYYSNKELAQELRYIASLPSCRLLESEKRLKDLEKELQAVRHELQKAKEEMLAKDERLAQFSEMMLALTIPEGSRAEEAHAADEEEMPPINGRESVESSSKVQTEEDAISDSSGQKTGEEANEDKELASDRQGNEELNGETAADPNEEELKNTEDKRDVPTQHSQDAGAHQEASSSGSTSVNKGKADTDGTSASGPEGMIKSSSQQQQPFNFSGLTIKPPLNFDFSSAGKPAAGNNEVLQPPNKASSKKTGSSGAVFSFGSISFGGTSKTPSPVESTETQQKPSGSSFSSGTFGDLSGSSSSPQQTDFGSQPQPQGSPVRFTPVNVCCDTSIKYGVSRLVHKRHQTITSMEEYEKKSVDEIRMEDYNLGRNKKPGSQLHGEHSVLPPALRKTETIGELLRRSKPAFGAVTTTTSTPSVPNSGETSREKPF